MQYKQNGGGLVGNLSPGSRIKKALGRGDDGDGEGMVAGQGLMSSLNIPNNPGPAVAGRTPLVGSLRRSRDMMVLRDRLRN